MMRFVHISDLLSR